MTYYISEVGNLSIFEARAVDRLIADIEANAAKMIATLKYAADMAQQLTSIGQTAAAANYSQQAMEARRQLGETYNLLGHSWTYFGDNHHALAAYRMAQKIEPRDVDASIFIGRSLLDEGDTEGALAALERAKADDGDDDAMLLYYLGEAYFASGNVAQSSECYRRLLGQAPPDQIVRNAEKSYLLDRWRRFARLAVPSLNRNMRWQAAVSKDEQVERDFARLQRIAGGRPIYITHMCGRGWILSHMVNQIEAFVRHLRLKGVENPFVVVLNADEFCNPALVKMYDRVLWLVDERYPRLRRRLINVRESLKGKGSPIAAPIDPHNPRPHLVNKYPAQQDYWIKAPRLLHFTAAEEAEGKKVLDSLGIGDKEFVCFGIRETNYFNARGARTETHHYWEANLRTGFEHANERELGAIDPEKRHTEGVSQRTEALYTRLADYLPMAQRLAQQGMFVLRMGTMVGEPIPEELAPRVIDYAKKHRTDFGDVYLFAKCKFVVAGGTGTMWISAAFGRPVINTDMYLVNNAFFNTDPNGIPNLSLPRKYWYKDEKRFLTYSEAFKVFRRYEVSSNCLADGIENIANTAEEISAVVQEMNDRIDGRWVDMPEDEELQNRFRALHLPRDHGYGINGRIGAKFLRDNVDLIR